MCWLGEEYLLTSVERPKPNLTPVPHAGCLGTAAEPQRDLKMFKKQHQVPGSGRFERLKTICPLEKKSKSQIERQVNAEGDVE